MAEASSAKRRVRGGARNLSATDRQVRRLFHAPRSTAVSDRRIRPRTPVVPGALRAAARRVPALVRLLLATRLLTGMRISETARADLGRCRAGRRVDPRSGAALSANAGKPARRVAPKTVSAIRQIPIVPQLTAILRAHRRGWVIHAGGDWVFVTRNGRPLSQRDVLRRALAHAADAAGLREAHSRGDPAGPPCASSFLDAGGHARHQLRARRGRQAPVQPRRAARLAGRSPRAPREHRMHHRATRWSIPCRPRCPTLAHQP
jgi:integrase